MNEPAKNIGLVCKNCMEKKHQDFQETFVDVVNPGDHAKIQIVDGDDRKEWMWILVDEVLRNGAMIGRLDNEPFIITNHNYGDTVGFARKDMMDHMKKGTRL